MYIIVISGKYLMLSGNLTDKKKEARQFENPKMAEMVARSKHGVVIEWRP